MGFTDTLKEDFVDASYRTAAKQISDLFKTGIINILNNQAKKPSKQQLKAIKELLDGELGASAIAYAIGMALDNLPVFKDDARARRLAREFRVHGMSKAGNFLADKVIAQFLPALTGQLQNLPIVQEVEQEIRTNKIMGMVDSK